jgi:hypothetical protein
MSLAVGRLSGLGELGFEAVGLAEEFFGAGIAKQK